VLIATQGPWGEAQGDEDGGNVISGPNWGGCGGSVAKRRERGGRAQVGAQARFMTWERGHVT